MKNRPLIVIAFVLAAAVTQAEARSIGAITADPLGPRSEPTVTVAQAVARTQIEKNGYSSVRGVSRGTDGTWHAVARNASNTPVAVVLDNQGKVVEAR